MAALDDFIAELAKIRLPSAFNPYSETCAVHDKRGAPRMRRENLAAVLSAALSQNTRTIWFGRDLGHRGGRRTGIPLTDETTVALLANRLGIIEIAKATRTPDYTEQTASAIWNAIAGISEVPVLWNAFPYHPFEAGKPASNRKHSRTEADAAAHILRSLLALLKPTRLITLGNDATDALERLGYKPIHVRHPSFGGKRDFHTGIISAYRSGAA